MLKTISRTTVTKTMTTLPNDTDTDTELLSDNEGNVTAGNCDSPTAQDDATVADDKAIALNDTGGDVEIGNTDDNSEMDNRQNYDNEWEQKTTSVLRKMMMSAIRILIPKLLLKLRLSMRKVSMTMVIQTTQMRTRTMNNSDWEVTNDQEDMYNDNSDCRRVNE